MQDNENSVLNTKSAVNTPYKLAIFDFDGTLCDTEIVDIRAITKTYRSLNQSPPTVEAIKKVFGKGLIIEEFFPYLSGNLSTHELEQLVKTYKAIQPLEAPNASLFNGVERVLKRLQAAGVDMIIVSNKPTPALQSGMQLLGIEHYFKLVIGTQEDKLCKPNPTVYKLKVAPHFPHLSPKEMLMIGDTGTDLAFAANIGVDACWVSYGGGKAKYLNHLSYHYTAKEPAELLNIILQRTDGPHQES